MAEIRSVNARHRYTLVASVSYTNFDVVSRNSMFFLEYNLDRIRREEGQENG